MRRERGLQRSLSAVDLVADKYTAPVYKAKSPHGDWGRWRRLHLGLAVWRTRRLHLYEYRDSSTIAEFVGISEDKAKNDTCMRSD